MPHRDPRRALLHARALSHERTILPGADPGLCHRGCLGVIDVGWGFWAPSANVVDTHTPLASLASLALLSPSTALGLHALALSSSLSTGSMQAALDVRWQSEPCVGTVILSACIATTLHRSPSL